MRNLKSLRSISLRCVSLRLASLRCISLSVLLFSCDSNAWEISELFSNMSANFTPPGTFQDQASGMYTGGGYSMRNRRQTLQPFSITPPSLKMGCGGIDMYFGSLEFMSSQQLVNLAKTLATQVPSYGFQLALKTFAPQIENLLTSLRNLSVELNEFSVEDCHLVQSAFASVLHEDSAMFENVCKDMSRQSSGSDYFGARSKCAQGAQARKEAHKYQASQNHEVMLDNFNLFIMAARKAGMPQDELEGAMSIAGTVVVREGVRTVFDALVVDDDTFNAHLKGGVASRYVCDDKASPTQTCLRPVLNQKQTISIKESYQGKAERRLNAIKMKMVNNQGFSQEDKEFLSAIGESFPIYNFIALEAVTGVHFLDKASDLVATALIVHTLNNVIVEIRRCVRLLEGKQIAQDSFVQYLERLSGVQSFLASKHMACLDRAKSTQERAEYIRKYHKAKIN